MSVAILISACLIGIRCRYDGTAKTDPRILDFLHVHGLIPIPVCPEQLGGLPTPRPPCNFRKGNGREVVTGKGQVVRIDGQDMTPFFLKGAEETLGIARQCGCRVALMKECSPSCGVSKVYRGTELHTGLGVATALLVEHGIRVFSEEDLAGLLECLAENERNKKSLY